MTETPDENNAIQGPVLILIRGLPGSGKSYLAKALASAIGEDQTVILDPDAIPYTSKEYIDLSKALTIEGIEAKVHPYRFLKAHAQVAITDRKIIIWNQSFTHLQGFSNLIARLQEYADEHGILLPILIIEVAATPDTVKARVAERAKQGGHDVPEAEFARFFRDYRSFADEGFDVLPVNGEDDVTLSVSTVIQALKALIKTN